MQVNHLRRHLRRGGSSHRIVEHLAGAVFAATAVARDAGVVLQHFKVGHAFTHGALDVAVRDSMAQADDHGGRSSELADSLQECESFSFVKTYGFCGFS